MDCNASTDRHTGGKKGEFENLGERARIANVAGEAVQPPPACENGSGGGNGGEMSKPPYIGRIILENCSMFDTQNDVPSSDQVMHCAGRWGGGGEAGGRVGRWTDAAIQVSAQASCGRAEAGPGGPGDGGHNMYDVMYDVRRGRGWVERSR